MIRLSALVVICLVSCATGPEREAELEQFGPLELAPPDGWTARELAVDTREWVPARNDRHEAVTVIIGPKTLDGAERAFRMTRVALGLLPEGQLVRSAKVLTRSGMPGMQFDVTFRPAAGSGRTYRRSHVVLFANERTFHVLYTVGDSEPPGTALAHVLDTIELEG